MGFQHGFHRLACRRKRRIVERAIGECRGKTRGHQQHVALAEWHIEPLGQT